MFMRKMMKFVICALACVVCVVSLSGCVEKTKDLTSIVAVINGTELTLGEFEAQYRAVKEYYLINMGMDLDAKENAQTNADLRLEFLDAIIQETVKNQNIKELGLDTFSEEDEEYIAREAEGLYEYYSYLFMRELSDLSDEQAAKELPGMLEENGVTIEALRNNVRLDMMEQRLVARVTTNIEVSDQEIQGQYEEYNNELSADLSNNPSVFPNLWNSNVLLTARLGGHYAYEWIQIGLEVEKEEELKALEKSNDPTYNATKAKYLNEIKNEAQSALNRVLGGENFKTVQAEYGVGGYYDLEKIPQETGYCITADSNDVYGEVVAAAMALTEDGQITQELIGANDGYYILMRVCEIDPEDVVTMEDGIEAFRTMAINDAKEMYYDVYTSLLVSAADVTKYENVLK